MGLDYSYEIAFRKDRVDDIILNLNDAIAPNSKSVVLQCLPWSPAKEINDHLVEHTELRYAGIGFSGLKLGQCEMVNHYCFSINIPVSSELTKECEEHGFYSDNNKIMRIGCVWTSIYVGNKYGLLSMTAATSSMSQLFYCSEQIKQFIVDTFSSKSRYILLDVEENYANLLYPKKRIINLGECEEYCFESNYEPSPDDYIEKIDAEFSNA